MSTLSLSRTAALTRARTNVAGQVEIHIKAAIIDYAQEAGEGDNKQVVTFYETVTKQIIDVKLSGLRNKATAVYPGAGQCSSAWSGYIEKGGNKHRCSGGGDSKHGE